MALEQDVQLAPDAEEVERLLAPFLVERHEIGSSAHRALLAKREAKWLWRGAKRKALGWLPGVKRDQSYVRDSYEETYTKAAFVQTYAPASSDPKPTLATYRDAGLLLRRRAIVRTHLVAMARAIELLKPKRVLEVGSGPGTNLFLFSARFPEIEFTGVELTSEGVAQGQRVMQEPELPKLLADYCPWEDLDRQAYRRVKLEQGDATQLRYDDASFDLVFTRQALEQMEMIRGEALSEIARVAKHDVLLCEPFADFQVTPLQRRYVAAKDYFSLRSDELPQFGIRPTHVVGDFPQNVEMGVGLVCGTRDRA